MQINIKTRQENLWFSLSDGMGGHRAGNIASEMAVTDLGAAWVSSEIETVNQVREWFAEHLEAVNLGFI